MTMPFRIAKPDEFTLKRDDDGRETIEHEGLIVARLEGKHHECVMLPGCAGLDNRRLVVAVQRAEWFGFWNWRGKRRAPNDMLFSVTVTA